jgi:DNA-binding transcriptional LysR family regulator
MNLNDVDLNLFVILDAIYSEGNLTRAGAVVGLSQPAMSNALARLRRACDDPLFVRTPQGMEPTPVARRMIGPARQALRLLGDALQSERAFDPAAAGDRFRLSMGDLTEARLLPPLLARLDAEAPGVAVESFQVPRREVLRELAAGSLDFAIDVPLLDDPSVRHAPLFHDRYVCVVRRGHPEVGDALTVDDFLALRHIHLSSRPRGAGHVDLALERLGLRRRIALRAQHYLMAPVVVARTDLALTVPLGFAEDLVNTHPVRMLELPFPVPPLESRLYWHASRDRDPANRWLRERLLELAAP